MDLDMYGINVAVFSFPNEMRNLDSEELLNSMCTFTDESNEEKICENVKSQLEPVDTVGWFAGSSLNKYLHE